MEDILINVTQLAQKLGLARSTVKCRTTRTSAAPCKQTIVAAAWEQATLEPVGRRRLAREAADAAGGVMQTETVTIAEEWEAYCDDCSALDAEAPYKSTAQVDGRGDTCREITLTP